MLRLCADIVRAKTVCCDCVLTLYTETKCAETVCSDCLARLCAETLCVKVVLKPCVLRLCVLKLCWELQKKNPGLVLGSLTSLLVLDDIPNSHWDQAIVSVEFEISD